MDSKEFVIWMKGFVEACNEYAPTPKQWDTIKDELAKVNDNTLSDLLKNPDTFRIHKEPVYPNVPNFPQPGINPYYIGDPPGWMQPFTTSGTNTDFKFTATNGQSGSI